MSKTIAQVQAQYPSFIPDYDDPFVVWDTSTGLSKATTNPTGALFKTLATSDTGANGSSAQPWFPTAGSVLLNASTTYLVEGFLRLSRAAGTTSHTTSILFGGTATLTNISYNVICNTGDVVTNGAANMTQSEIVGDTVVKAASTSATEQTAIKVYGTIRTNASGTLIPQFKYSATPGGVPTVLTNSFFKLTPIGSNAVTISGTWA